MEQYSTFLDIVFIRRKVTLKGAIVIHTESWTVKDRNHPYIWALLGVVVVTIITTLVFWRNDIVSWETFAWAAFQEFIYNLAVMVIVMFAFGIQRRKYIKESMKYRMDIDNLRERLQSRVNSESAPSAEQNTSAYIDDDIIELMLDNMRETREYFTISKKQAKSSYTVAIVACALGFLLLCCSLFFMLYYKNIDTAILGAVSGIITEFFGASAFFVYKKSITQLNKYYESLTKTEQFLSVVSLVGKMTPQKRDEMYIEIIRSSMAA